MTKRLYSAKRLYFTCRIKALYMMKEFGVKFEWRQKVKASAYDIFHDWGKTELHSGHTVDDFISDEVNYGSDAIYVALESEHIFEPNEGDKGIERNLSSQDLCFYGGKYWAYENEEMQKTPHQARVAIIMRANKQFFEAEVENER